MGKNTTNDMTQGNCMRLLVQFFLPILAGNLFQQLYSFADSMVVGKGIGDTAREFDTSFFIIVIQILCLSRFRLIFLSNFMILYVLFCAFCGIIDSIGGFLNVYQYHWQQR